jgi:hypothetical protein
VDIIHSQANYLCEVFIIASIAGNILLSPAVFKFMNDFSLWFSSGLHHILDWQGYDHLLFVTLLVLAHDPSQWKKLLLLITGFTTGHCITLAISVKADIHVDQPITELLIALSILFTACYELYLGFKRKQSKWILVFVLVFVFGLVHGLGFSFYLRSMLGSSESVILPLLYFNVGIEAGQLIIVLFIWLFSLFLAGPLKIKHQLYQGIIVCIILLIALNITAERLLQLF